MPPRPAPFLPTGVQRLRWWLVVGLAAFLMASVASWVTAAVPAAAVARLADGHGGTVSTSQHTASRSDSAPAPSPSRALDVNGDSVPDLVLPSPAVTLTTRPATVRRVRRASAAVPYGHQVAPVPQPPRVIA